MAFDNKTKHRAGAHQPDEEVQLAHMRNLLVDPITVLTVCAAIGTIIGAACAVYQCFTAKKNQDGTVKVVTYKDGMKYEATITPPSDAKDVSIKFNKDGTVVSIDYKTNRRCARNGGVQ